MTGVRQSRSGSREGLSLTELLLITAIASALLSIVFQLTMRAREVSRHTPLLNRANEIHQDLLQELRSDLLSSVKLFPDGPVGTAYLAMSDMVDASPAIKSALPTLRADTQSAPEMLTGNTLLFAKYVWTDEYECSSGNRYTSDVYRLVRYYLAERQSESALPAGLSFCRWVSEPMVDGDQVDDITDATDRAEVLDHLLNGTPDADGVGRPRVEVVWRPGEDPRATGTLRQIGLGGFLSSSPLPSRGSQWRILREASGSSNGLLDGEPFAVASEVVEVPHGDLDSGERPRDGFEVQITGPSGARRIVIDLVIVSTDGGRLPARSSLRIAVNTRDL